MTRHPIQPQRGAGYCKQAGSSQSYEDEGQITAGGNHVYACSEYQNDM